MEPFATLQDLYLDPLLLPLSLPNRGLAPVPTSHLSPLASLSRTSAFLTAHSLTFSSIVRDLEGRRGCCSYVRSDVEVVSLDDRPHCVVHGAVSSRSFSSFLLWKSELYSEIHALFNLRLR
ncbi:uncharacterized protein LAESUDRAFT_60182 [Laetiporus sulphureus 93-53]|uniref:Uncharacterized protein n=1 Tax=Laetiporus sulphureus 93-53 TaxID=1314785 RepID=A0A165AXL3_9APHY|nr:uncharacterized protein LAESUDRAFT_60182 [Laetiporus sulphureus 93-53]KZS99850.1 hypothetical protein LAESUDRAFT_60182 [Laetiporus sulphureus 93-53]